MGLKTRLASIGSKLKTFFVTVFEDYKAVASDTAADMRKKPIRGAMKVGTVALIIQAVRKNPELESYYRLLTQSRVELGLLSEKTRNKGAERWMQSITTLVNKKRLRATNMFFMTVLWQSDFPTNCDLFEANCGSVKPRWRDYFSRIVDVGLFGHWLLLEQRMEDFDVNHEEFDMPYKSGMTIQLQA